VFIISNIGKIYKYDCVATFTTASCHKKFTQQIYVKLKISISTKLYTTERPVSYVQHTTAIIHTNQTDLITKCITSWLTLAALNCTLVLATFLCSFAM